jgi:hypothetical protein
MVKMLPGLVGLAEEEPHNIELAPGGTRCGACRASPSTGGDVASSQALSARTAIESSSEEYTLAFIIIVSDCIGRVGGDHMLKTRYL